MQTPWDELLQFDDFDSVGDIIDVEGGNPFAGGGSDSGGGGNPFAGGGNSNAAGFGQTTDTGVGNTENGNGNQYFGNDNETNGNGNWYISQESDLPENFMEGEGNSFIDSLFADNGNSIGGNNPAFAGGGVPSFAGGGDFSTITGADNNQTEGNGNWNFGANNTTDGNGNWELGSNNQTEGNANWNLGDNNQVTGNGNQPGGDNNQVTGNGNQPSGDDNQINGNRVSSDEDSQNIVGNGDRYLLMDDEGNIFVVDDESASDSQYEFDFEFLTNANGEDSETASLDQPFVQSLFSQFASGNGFSTDGADETEENNAQAGGGNPFAGGGNAFGGGSDSQGGGNPFAGGGNPFGGGSDSQGGGNPFAGGGNSSDDSSENQDSDLDEQLRQSPFGRLFDLPGVDGAEDIFGNLGAPSGEGNPFGGDGEGGGIGEGSPFAFWNPLTEGNPFTPEDDMPENENIGGGNPFAGGGNDSGGGNPFAGGGNPFGGGSDSESGGNPFAGGGNDSGGESIASPWDELLQFEEFDSVEDVLGLSNGNSFGGDNDSQGGGNPFAGGSDSEGGGNPFAGGGNNSGGESMESPWDELLQFEEFDSIEDIFNSDGETEFSFEDTDAFTEIFAETSVGDLLDFPGVDSPEDIFSTFGIDEDADGENLLENWNPFTDGNPFVADDEEDIEPVYNADGDRILEENQFGYLILDSEETLFLSTDDLIDDSDVEIGQEGFSEDLFSSDEDSLIDGEVVVGNLLEGLEGELAIEIEDGYLINNEAGEWFVSRDEVIGEEDISLGSSDLFSDSNPFAGDIEQFLSSSSFPENLSTANE